MKKSLATALVLFAVATGNFAATVPAAAASYLTTGGSQTSIGDTIGSPYDQLFLDPFAGTISGSGVYELNALRFIAGVNANVASCCNPGTISESLTIGATTHTLNVPFTLAINSSDTLTILGGTTLFYPGYKVVLDGAGPLVNGGGEVDSVLNATVTAVPEPAQWVLLLLGFFGVGVIMRRAGGASSLAVA